MAARNHRQKTYSVRCYVLTISDTRTMDTDKSGILIGEFLRESGHVAVERTVIPDDAHVIREIVLDACQNPDIDVILANGGTGISPRDVTIETVRELFDKEITGFGELFRMLSYTEDIGSSAMMSRAIAGIRQRTAIFAVPGSSGAVKLAMRKLILPELSHVVYELGKAI